MYIHNKWKSSAENCGFPIQYIFILKIPEFLNLKPKTSKHRLTHYLSTAKEVLCEMDRKAYSRCLLKLSLNISLNNQYLYSQIKIYSFFSRPLQGVIAIAICDRWSMVSEQTPSGNPRNLWTSRDDAKFKFSNTAKDFKVGKLSGLNWMDLELNTNIFIREKQRDRMY